MFLLALCEQARAKARRRKKRRRRFLPELDKINLLRGERAISGSRELFTLARYAKMHSSAIAQQGLFCLVRQAVCFRCELASGENKKSARTSRNALSVSKLTFTPHLYDSTLWRRCQEVLRHPAPPFPLGKGRGDWGKIKSLQNAKSLLARA